MYNITFETLDLRLLFSLFRLAIDSSKVYNTKHENETNRQKQKEQFNINIILQRNENFTWSTQHTSVRLSQLT